MEISRLFILRPVATSLLMVAIMLTGLLAYRLLPLSALPEVDYPTIQVNTLYPGASADVVASSITAPLERQFGQMPGLNQMSSTSSAGASVITLQFALQLPLDVAEQEVQAAINAAATFLPFDLPNPPIYSKINPADAPVLTLALTSSTLPLTRVQELADTRLAQKLSQIKGVGLVSVAGGRRPAVRVQANPAALAAYQMSLADVRTAIAAANVNQPKGGFDGPERAYTIDANDQLRSAAEFTALILAHRNGAPVRLGDVATILDDAENTRLAAWRDGAAAIVLSIRRQPGANVIEVVDLIKQRLPQLRSHLPAAVDVAVLTDRTTTIRASVRDVQFELAFAIALVVAVIFLFLRSPAATAIPAVAVPLSLVGTFGVMYLAGFSINNLTLMALTVATGFVVDDAIVMIENIARHLEAGETPLQAALKGAAQIGFTIVSLTLSLIAVLIPLLFMSDVVGRLFREFAVTLAVTILISAVVSLTLTPMMCARLLRRSPDVAPGRFSRAVGRLLDDAIARYGRMLEWVLDHQSLTLLVTAATVLLSVVLYVVVPKGFFPLQDTGLIQAVTEAPQTVSFAGMVERQQKLVRTLLQDPAVDNVSSFVGVDGINPTLNNGRLLIALKPLAKRKTPVAQVIRRLQQRATPIPGIALYLQPVQDLTIEAQLSRTQYQFVVDGPDPAQLAAWVPRLQQRLTTLPQLRDVAVDLQDSGLQTLVDIDRDAAARLGITATDVDNALYDAFGQRPVSTIFTQANQYRVVLEVLPEFRAGPDALQAIHVKSSAGELVPLASVARVSEQPVPLAVNRLGQFPAATISFNLAPHAALGDAVNAVERAVDALGLPPGMRGGFQGSAQAFRASLANQLLLILAAIVVVYIVLGVLYESYIHPVTILSTLPSAGVGALLALLLAGSPLDVISLIGIVLLIGIVKKNAIMMIDFALDAERREGKDPRTAIFQASLQRFRPIMMTTLAALFGALPLMLGGGTGSELRNPLGISIVGGLVVSQVLTLFTTPVIYLAFDRLARRESAPAPTPAGRVMAREPG